MNPHETPNTRDHLLEVGLRLIRSMGYASTGMKEILDEARVPKGSFYHYFPSKEAYASEVLKLYAQGERERCQAILGDHTLPPLPRLRRYFDELIRVYGPSSAVTGCLMGNLSLEMAGQSDSIQGILHESFSIWQSALADVLREAIDRGDLAPTFEPEEMADFLINGYEGALLRSKADRSMKPLETFVHFTFTVLLKPTA
jgi:TetR/AcrR family transcriptional repressor of nem operon